MATVDPAVRRAGMIAVCTIIGPVPEAGGQIMATTWVLRVWISSALIFSLCFQTSVW